MTWDAFVFICVLVYFATTSLQPQQDLPIPPQLFEVVKVTLVGGEKMHNHIAIIHNHPAIAGKTLFPALPPVFLADVVDSGVSKRIEHAVAGTGADNKIVGKRDNTSQVDQDNVLTLFIFKGVHNFTGKFECVQDSPHGLVNGAENNFV